MAASGRRVLPRVLAALSVTASLLFGSAAAANAEPAVTSIRAQEWWLGTMHAPDSMWPISTGKGITVAVIDSGVDAEHPDLAGQILAGQNFSGLPGGAETDTSGHGTAMASLIAGTGKGLAGKGMYGLAPGAKILPLRVVAHGDNEADNAADFASQLAAAIRAAADSSAQIINISMVQVEAEPNVRSAVEYALSKGKLIVAGVGNSGNSGNPVEYPAAYPGVVAVGETDKSGNVAPESEHGPQVSLTAAGADMYEACASPSGYCSGHGTSNSTAIVSASAALLWSVHPTWTADQIIRVLIDTANAGGKPGVQDPYYGYGLVRPRIALASPGDPGPADVNPLLPVVATHSPAAAPSSPAAVSAPGGDAAGRASSGGGSGLWVAVGGAVGALLLGGVVVAVVVRRRRRRSDRPGPPPPPSAASQDPYAHLPR
jgi:type VII secretion-associated serine protease mycosin